MLVGRRRGCLVQAHVQRCFASPVVEVHDQSLGPLGYLHLEVLIEAGVAAQQPVFNTRCEGNGVIGLDVFGRVNKVGHDGEPSGVSETVGGDVVEAGFNIEQMHLFVVAGVGRPCHAFRLGKTGCFTRSIHLAPPNLLRDGRTVERETDVDVPSTVVSSDAQIGQRFGDVDVVVIRIEIAAGERILGHLLIRHRDAFHEFSHVVERRWWVGHIGVQFNVEIFNVAVKHHREPHHAF